MITNKQFMAYVSALRSPTALLASANSDFPSDLPYYSGVQGRVVDEKPVANILQKIHSIKTDMTLFLNYKPSELELGMAWRAGEIKRIYFIESENPLLIKHYIVDQDGCHIQPDCDLSDVTPCSPEEMVAIQEEDPRIKNAFQRPINQRTVSTFTSQRLRRGLDTQEPIIDERDSKKTDEDFMRLTLALVERSWNDKSGINHPLERAAGNNIGAIMVDANNKIIGWGLNLKSKNKTFHAETLMIQHYLRENNTDRLPDGVKIYTSLECCHMCAGYIADMSHGARVIFAQKDPFFNGDNALKRGVNGCSQEQTTLPLSRMFGQLMQEEEDILTFLFNDRSKGIFQRGYQDPALFVELLEAVQNRMAKMLNQKPTGDSNEITQTLNNIASPVLAIGETFLSNLGEIAPPSASTQGPNFFSSRSPAVSRTPSPTGSETSSSSVQAGMEALQQTNDEDACLSLKRELSDLKETETQSKTETVSLKKR